MNYNGIMWTRDWTRFDWNDYQQKLYEFKKGYITDNIELLTNEDLAEYFRWLEINNPVMYAIYEFAALLDKMGLDEKNIQKCLEDKDLMLRLMDMPIEKILTGDISKLEDILVNMIHIGEMQEDNVMEHIPSQEEIHHEVQE